MFRYLLKLTDGEPNDPAAFVTAVPNWNVGEIIPLGRGEELRVLAIETDIADELIDAGFNGIFVVARRA
jgi:hypothetical protein